MNWRHVKILVWEHLRRTLPTVVPITLLFVSLDLAWQLLTRNTEDPMVEDPVVLMGAGLFANLILQLVNNTNSSNLQFSVSPYYLRLPVHPWLFAFTRMILGAATISVATLLLYHVHYNAIAQPPQSIWFDWSLNIWFVLSAMIALYAFVQVVAWATGQWTTIGTLALVFYFCVGGITPYEWHYATDAGAIVYPIALGGLVVAAILGAEALRYARSGERIPIYGNGISLVERIGDLFDNVPSNDAVPFESRGEALVWLERRYMRNLFPIVFAVFLIITSAIISLDIGQWDLAQIGRGLIGVFLAAATFAGTIFTLIAVRRHSTGERAFTLTKPATITELSNARLRSMISQLLYPALIVQIGILAIVVTQLVFVGEDLPDLPLGDGSVDFLIGQLVYLYFMYLGVLILAWCALWCAVTFPVGVWWAYLFAGFFFVLAEAKLLTSDNDLPSWAHQDVLVLTLIPIGVVWIRALVKHLAVGFGAVLFAAPIVFVGVYSALEILEFSAPGGTVPLIIASAALLPFALTPQFVEHQRHR